MTSVSNADVSRREGPPTVETPGAKDRIGTTLTLIALFPSDDTCPLNHQRVLSGNHRRPASVGRRRAEIPVIKSIPFAPHGRWPRARAD